MDIKELARKPVSLGRQSDLNLLAPFVKKRAENALFECHQSGFMVYPFETYRDPLRQAELYAKGRTAPGKIVTYAKPWQSWHAYSVALDAVFKNGKSWLWEGPWDKVQAIFESHGFESLEFEKPHFQMRGSLSVTEAYEILQHDGIEAVWAAIEACYR